MAYLGQTYPSASVTTTEAGLNLLEAQTAEEQRGLLELGTGATSTVTTSATDTTAGRLLKVGDTTPILNGVKEVDGAGSGLDADTVDGLHASQFLRSDDTDSAAGRITFQSLPQTGGIATSTASLGSLEVYGNSIQASMMAFHRAGTHAAYFGIDTDNQFKVGGWSMGNNAYKIWHDGNAIASIVGNGYQKLPSGLIIQWGAFSNPANSSVNITFPIAFPNVVQGVYPSILQSDLTNAERNIRYFNLTTSGCTINTATENGGGTCTWFAIGW